MTEKKHQQAEKSQLSFANPVDAYADLDIPEQQQPEPGLDADLTPKPDRGEKTYRGLGRLAGRKALVTGGDSGIGAAVVIAFAREGADVAFGYLPEEQKDADTIKALVEAEGRVAVPLPGDITSAENCRELVSQAAEKLGGLDILVNNAGHQKAVESLEELTDEQFQQTLDTNLSAMFWITKAALPHLVPGSTIINTTSIQAYKPSETLVDYATTKGRHQQLHQGPGAAVGAQGHPGERRGSRPDLDAASGAGWPADREAAEVRQGHPAGSSRPPGGACPGLRLPGLPGVQLCDRRDAQRQWRDADALTSRPVRGPFGGAGRPFWVSTATTPVEVP